MTLLQCTVLSQPWRDAYRAERYIGKRNTCFQIVFERTAVLQTLERKEAMSASTAQEPFYPSETHTASMAELDDAVLVMCL